MPWIKERSPRDGTQGPFTIAFDLRPGAMPPTRKPSRQAKLFSCPYGVVTKRNVWARRVLIYLPVHTLLGLELRDHGRAMACGYWHGWSADRHLQILDAAGLFPVSGPNVWAALRAPIADYGIREPLTPHFAMCQSGANANPAYSLIEIVRRDLQGNIAREFTVDGPRNANAGLYVPYRAQDRQKRYVPPPPPSQALIAPAHTPPGIPQWAALTTPQAPMTLNFLETMWDEPLTPNPPLITEF